MSKEKKINSIVVGSGFGGIASALRLRALGHKVTLIDRLPEIGGRAQVFNLINAGICLNINQKELNGLSDN